MSKIDKIEKVYALLKDYSGKNPYIYRMKKNVLVYGQSLNEYQMDFVIRNIDFEPVKVDKIVMLADWYAERKQAEWKTWYVPYRIEVSYLIGETETSYAAYIRYSQKQEKPVLCFLSRKGIVTNLMCDDYTKVEIDFDKFDRMSKNPNIKIKEFQKDAVRFLVSRKKAILADSQGYGKTIEAIIAMLATDFHKAFIICPASLKSNWKNELSNYVDENEIEVVSGGRWKESRFTIANYDILDNFYTVPSEPVYRKIKDIDDEGRIVERREIVWAKKPKYDRDGILIEDGVPKTKVSTNPEKIRKAMEESQLFQSHFDLVIIDEVHKLCNSTSGRYKIISDFLKRSNPKYIFLMSGTPISNRPINFYNVLKLINADITKDYNHYVMRYCDGQIIYLKGEKWKWTQYFLKLKHKEYNQLTETDRNELNEFLLRNARHVTKATGATNLEELKEKTKHLYLRRLTSDIKDMVKKNVVVYRYDLDKWQREEYDRLFEDYIKKMDDDVKDEKRLHQAIIESSIMRQFLAKEMVDNTIDLAESILEESEKLIIMCTFDSEIEMLKNHFGDRCVVYNGKMTTTQKDKAELHFKSYSNIQVFIGNVNAAGVGLNLQVAHDLIFNSFTYVSGDNSQAEDRVFRQTQTQDCTIYYQLFRNTFSEEMYDKVLSKESNITQILKKEADK